jgi:hypothetical protein
MWSRTKCTMHVWRNIKAHSRNHCCPTKAVSITYSKCVCIAVGIQHAMRMRLILSSVACPALQYFSTLSHKFYDFRKKLLNIKCVFWVSLQLVSAKFLLLRRNEWDMIKNVNLSSCKGPVILVIFLWNLNFLDFQKILPVQTWTGP